MLPVGGPPGKWRRHLRRGLLSLLSLIHAFHLLPTLAVWQRVLEMHADTEGDINMYAFAHEKTNRMHLTVLIFDYLPQLDVTLASGHG